MIQQAQYTETPGMAEWSNSPVVAALGKFYDQDGLRNALYANPYRGLDLSPLPAYLLDSQIDKLTTDAFVVGVAELEFATVMQRMLFNGLSRRDPTRGKVMAEIAQFANFKGLEIDNIPWSSNWADAGMVDEITGQGKSHIPQRILKLWPPAIRHDRKEGLWEQWFQLVYLSLDMSYDGNLRGLLQHILNAVDATFEGQTNYAEEIPRKAKNIAQMQVYVIDVLKRHFCGLIVLDELQAVSLLLGKDARFVANFFLRLLNQGIPIIFEGNPFAFKPFEKVSQLWDRFTSVPFPSLTPVVYDDDDMLSFYLPELWKMQVMPRCAALDDPMMSAIYQCSAWHRRHISRALQNGQRYALGRGVDALEPNDVLEGFRLLADERTQERIEAFVMRNPEPLLKWNDIPVLSLIDQWSIEDDTVRQLAQLHDEVAVSSQSESLSKNDEKSVSKPVQRKTVSDVISAEQRKVKNRLTRMAKAAAKAKAQNIDGADDPDDLRKQGLTSALVKGFEGLASATLSRRPTTTGGFEVKHKRSGTKNKASGRGI